MTSSMKIKSIVHLFLSLLGILFLSTSCLDEDACTTETYTSPATFVRWIECKYAERIDDLIKRKQEVFKTSIPNLVDKVKELEKIKQEVM